MPTDDVGIDVQNLGEQVHDVLVEMQLPKFSERLGSQSLTIMYLLNLVGNAVLFAEDCSKPEFKGTWHAEATQAFWNFERKRIRDC